MTLANLDGSRMTNDSPLGVQVAMLSLAGSDRILWSYHSMKIDVCKIIVDIDICENKE